jgi:hypothetical protein
MSAYNINVPIEEIYADIMENNNIFNYDRILLKYHQPAESFGIYPKWGKIIPEPYYFIEIDFVILKQDSGWFSIQYENSDKVYLRFSGLYRKAPRHVIDFTAYKLNELKLFLIEKYKLADEDIEISIYY